MVKNNIQKTCKITLFFMLLSMSIAQYVQANDTPQIATTETAQSQESQTNVNKDSEIKNENTQTQVSEKSFIDRHAEKILAVLFAVFCYLLNKHLNEVRQPPALPVDPTKVRRMVRGIFSGQQLLEKLGYPADMTLEQAKAIDKFIYDHGSTISFEEAQKFGVAVTSLFFPYGASH